MSDRPFDHPPDWPGGDELTVRLNQEEINDTAREGHIAFLFSKIPIGYQERLRPYLFGNVLNSSQREVLVTDAVAAKDSEELKEVEARAKDWTEKASATQRTLGEAATQTITGAPDTQAFLSSVLGEEELAAADVDIQLPNDIAMTSQDSSETGAGQYTISQEEPQSSTSETGEQVHTGRPLFANFKKALWVETDRYRELMNEGDNELHYRWDSHHRADFKPTETTIRNELTKHFKKAYLDEDAVPDQLAPHIYRALRPNERHHTVNYPHSFSPNKLLNALENRKFEALQASTRSITFPNERVQIPAAAITSVKFSTLQEGKVVELPEAAQPHNPTQLFEQCFNESLPAEAFLLLTGREKYASSYSIQFHVDELRIGALADDSIGLELVMRQPNEKEKRMRDVTMLAAALIGERKLATVLADTVVIY